LPGEDPFIQPWMVDFADDHYALDISRAKSILGWAPKRSLRAMLPKMVATLKANPLKWYKENKLPPPAELGAARLHPPPST
jgi:nucleoside-diphosphate-sugar epimerase